MFHSKKVLAVVILALAILLAWVIIECRQKQARVDEVLTQPAINTIKSNNAEVATVTPAANPTRSNRASSSEIMELIKRCEVKKIEHSISGFVAYTRDGFVSLIDRQNTQKTLDFAKDVGISCVPPIEILFVIPTCPGHPEDCL
jgi:hypothetical protein